MAVAERPDVEEAEDTRERVTVWDTGEVLFVHPVASLFPMMTAEELDDLAADIKANGQAEPITVDQHAQLLDGRNRLEACRRAEVCPDFIRVALDDPIAFILSKNINRRHLSKGQAAMATARAVQFLDTSVREAAAAAGLKKSRVSQAMVVLEHAPDLTSKVLSGATGLDDAYHIATDRKRAADSDEAQMERLRLEASDLATLVTEGALPLSEAMAALRKREENALAHRQATTRLIAGAMLALDPGGWETANRADALWEGFDPSLLPDGQGMTVERLRACAAVLEQLIARVEAAVDDR
jgi:ParB-like chromosome segregation protein Spo0J